jgi:hypothetical protein
MRKKLLAVETGAFTAVHEVQDMLRVDCAPYSLQVMPKTLLFSLAAFVSDS